MSQDSTISNLSPASALTGAEIIPIDQGQTKRTTASALKTFVASGPFDPNNINFTQAGTGAVTRTLQSKEQDIVSVKDFGAKGDGVTDDTSAIQAAINSLGSRGGDILFPANSNLIYQCASGLSLDDKVGIRLIGQGVGTGGGSGGMLRFSGTGTCISARSTTGFEINGLGIQATNGANTGHLIDLSHSSGGGDSQLWRIEKCSLIGSSATGSMLSLINTERAIIGSIRENFFTTCPIGILGRATNSAFYCNGIQVIGNTFASIGTMPIRNMGQGWLVHGNTFENLSNGNAGAIDFQTGVPFSGVGISIEGNWFGDGNTSGTWISLFGSGFKVSGNYISTGATGITIGGAGTSGVEISANQFDTVTTAFNVAAAATELAHFGNSYNTVTNKISNIANATGANSDVFTGIVLTGGAPSSRSIWATATQMILQGGSAGGVLNDSGNTKNILTWTDAGLVNIVSGQFYPATPALATQSASGLFAGTGVPNNANGNNGDIYFRSDGGAGTTIYQRRAGAWVATGA